MATNLNIDDRLLTEARKIAGFKTKKETVNRALEEFVQHRKQMEILKLAGTIDFWPDHDHKKLRKMR